jgi:hypothetical protein
LKIFGLVGLDDGFIEFAISKPLDITGALMKRIGIIGTGSYLPEKIMKNFDIEKFLDTSDEWIFTRTGIREEGLPMKNRLPQIFARCVGKGFGDAGVRRRYRFKYSRNNNA